MAAEFGLHTGLRMRARARPYFWQEMCKSQLTWVWRRKNILQTNMCLRLYLQLAQQRGTDKQAHACVWARCGESGSGTARKHVSGTAVHLKRPQNKPIEQPVETLRLKAMVALNTHRIILLNIRVLCLSSASLDIKTLLIKMHRDAVILLLFTAFNAKVMSSFVLRENVLLVWAVICITNKPGSRFTAKHHQRDSDQGKICVLVNSIWTQPLDVARVCVCVEGLIERLTHSETHSNGASSCGL